MNAAAIQAVGQPTRRSDVSLRLPADGAYVSLLRTAAAGLGARLDFTMDDIEDLRMAVSEAYALVLPAADEDSDLVADFFLEPYQLTVEVSVTAEAPTPPDPDSWAWQVISALTVHADASATPGCLAVTMTLRSTTDI